MELSDYLAILQRRRSVLLRTFVLTVALVSVGAFFLPTRYDANAVLRLETISSGSVDFLDYELEYTDRLMNTYVEIAESGALQSDLVERLGNAAPPVSVTIRPETELLDVSVEADTPQAAVDTANTFAQLLMEQEAESVSSGRENVNLYIEQQLTALLTQITDLEEATAGVANESTRLQLLRERYETLAQQLESSQVSAALRRPPALSLVSAANVEASSASGNTLALLIPLGILLGLVGGVGLAFLSENLDPTLYSRSQIEGFGNAPILAAVPDRGRPKEWLVTKVEDAKAFKQMLENISLLSCGEGACKVFAFSSAEARAGKSTVVANLAYVAARAGQKVLLIDANVASPKMHAVYHLNNEEGFANLVSGEAPLHPALIQPTQVPSLSVLTSGSQELVRTPFGTNKQLERLAKLREHYDLILLDCPAILNVGSTVALAKHCDALLLVVARGHTQREELTLAQQRLDLAQVPARGVVLNYA